MGVDAFTLIAQLINFAILVVLLRVLLYRPIADAMRRRQERIAGELASAATREREAAAARDRWAALHATLEQEAADLRAAARAEAADEKAALLEEARREVDARVAEWNETVDRAKAAVADRVARDVSEQVRAALSRALAELASDDLEARVLERFLAELAALQPDERDALSNATTAEFRSARELDTDARHRVEAALSDLAPGAAPQFDVDPRLVSGYELLAAGRRWSWNVARFVDAVVQP